MLKLIYEKLYNYYSPQGWWPIVNDKTLMCEYFTGAPKNEAEKFEISIGAILTQGTQWYPNVVRAIQQLKIGRPFTKNELKLIQQAEWLYHKEFGNKGYKIDKPINAKIFNNYNESDIKPANISGNKQIITKGDILTQNTSWKNVEKALENLRKNNAISRAKLQVLGAEKIAELIKSSGYHNQKARKIKEYLKFDGEITRKSLLQIWGIGPETADSILLYACKQPIFVIDAYTKRIMSRIGYLFKSYEDLQQMFTQSIDSDYKVFNEYHALLVELGKNICKKEPLCSRCPLKERCSYARNKSDAAFVR